MRCVVVVSLLICSTAVAKPVHPVLRDDKRSWIYDVVAGETGKPTGKQQTLAVTKVEDRGAYTLILLGAKEGEASDHASLTLIAGPSGVREVINVDEESPGEKAFREAYEKRYLPRIYLPATLKKQQFKRNLNRWAEDSRIYQLNGSLAKRDAHTWRMTWKGSYRVPEEEGPEQDGSSRTKYAAIVDFDPDVGFTLICPLSDDKLCLRLHE